MKFKKWHKLFFLVITLSSLLGFFFVLENLRISIKRNTVKVKKLKIKDFLKSGFRKQLTEKRTYKIVHISDLHSRIFGENNSYLFQKIKNAKPDIILINGDLIDRRNDNFEVAEHFLDNLKDIIKLNPNHELKDHRIFTPMVIMRKSNNL